MSCMTRRNTGRYFFYKRRRDMNQTRDKWSKTLREIEKGTESGTVKIKPTIKRI